MGRFVGLCDRKKLNLAYLDPMNEISNVIVSYSD